MRYFYAVFGIGLWAAGMAGCGPKAKYLAPQYRAPETIAVLPFDNHSVDFDAPDIIRQLLQQGLSRRSYKVLPEAQVDGVLKELGISEGGQLKSVAPKKLGEKLGAQALLYGEIEEFKFVNVGFYQNRNVQVRAKLVEASTEQPLWEGDKTVSNKKLALDKNNAGRMFVEGLGERMLEKITKSPLREEAREAVRKLLATLPKQK